MSRAVYKQRLTFGANALSLPQCSALRHVHEQHGQMMLWYEADLSYQNELRMVYVLATGRPLPKPDAGSYNKYIGTIHLPDQTIWHVYEVAPNGH